MAFFDFVEDPTSETGAYLYITNDWIIDAASNRTVPTNCYNLFTVSTGGGAENWVIKVYGDATVWVSKNNEVVQERDDPVGGRVGGAAGFGPSPNVPFNHSIFELRFPASRGTEDVYGWRRVGAVVGLHDPTPGVMRHIKVGSRARTAVEEAQAMHQSTRGGGGCDMVFLAEPNNFSLPELQPDMGEVETSCLDPPCGIFDPEIVLTWAPSVSPSASPSMSPSAGSCANAVRDGGETDVDCGGVCPRRCGQGARCCHFNDCEGTRSCVNAGESCVPSNPESPSGTCSTLAPTSSPSMSPSASPSTASCANGVRDNAETCVDGGGNCPGSCGLGAGCCASSDCEGTRTCVSPGDACSAFNAGSLGACSTFSPSASPSASPATLSPTPPTWVPTAATSPTSSPTQAPVPTHIPTSGVGPTVAPSRSPSRSPSAGPSMSPAACELHPRCAAWGVRGLCCPTNSGTMLTCCEGEASDAPTKAPTTAAAPGGVGGQQAKKDKESTDKGEEVVAEGATAIALVFTMVGCCFCCVLLLTMRKKKGKEEDEKVQALDALMREIEQIAKEEGGPPPTMLRTLQPAPERAGTESRKKGRSKRKGGGGGGGGGGAGITSVVSRATHLTGVGGGGSGVSNKMKKRASSARKRKGKSHSHHSHRSHRRHASAAKPVTAAKKRWNMVSNQVKSPQERFASCAMIIQAAEKKKKKKSHRRRSSHHHHKSLKGAANIVKDAERLGGSHRSSHRKRRGSSAHRDQVKVQNAFDKLDSNGDGQLTFEEFKAACGGADGDGNVRKLFDLLDEDKGGTVDVRELAHALRLSDEARQMAAQYETLQELVKLSSQRKKRRQSSRRKSHKKRRETIDAASGPRNSKRRLKRQNTMTRPMGE